MRIREFLASKGFSVLRELVGEGGSATVHKAEAGVENSLGLEAATPVAVKVYRETLLAGAGQLARVRQEADLGQSISNDHIVRAFGLLEEGDNLVLVMQWIDGATLEEWVPKQRKNLAWSRAQTIALQLIDALQTLHAAGVWHRDVKPENIMVRSDDSTVLMDIGVAELASGDDHTLHTELKDFLGSVRYASPQYIQGEDFSAGDDVYSLGATLLYLFSGRRPYHKIDRKPVLPIRIVQAPPQVERLRDNVPGSIRILLQACLHPDLSRRPSLADVEAAVRDPDSSAFLTRELERQASESRTYTVIKVMDDGATFYADLLGDAPELDHEYRVVRRDAPLAVPSFQREVTPERWIVDAVLKHINQNVGYFKVMGRRWDEPRNSFASIQGLMGGHWVEYEKVVDKIREGDLVLRDSSDIGS